MATNNKVPKLKKATSILVYQEVVILKILILFVILILPLAIFAMILSQSTNRLALNKGSQSQLQQGQDNNIGADFNFAMPIPTAQAGDLANVPKEKIDTLFNNLKK